MTQQVEVVDGVGTSEHPATIDAVFAAALDEDTLGAASRSWNPTDWASRSAGTRPAADTKFGSSKTGRIV